MENEFEKLIDLHLLLYTSGKFDLEFLDIVLYLIVTYTTFLQSTVYFQKPMMTFEWFMTYS